MSGLDCGFALDNKSGDQVDRLRVENLVRRIWDILSVWQVGILRQHCFSKEQNVALLKV